MLAETLAALAGTDWPEPPVMHTDLAAAPRPAGEYPILRGHLGLLEKALAGPGTHFLVLEDDVALNRHLHHNLLHWALWARAAAVDFATLYNPGLAPAGPPGETCFAADPRTVIGAQGRLISRRGAEFLLEKGGGPGLRQDMRWARLAAAHFGAVWVHRPSLVQHRAAPSTWGGPAHTAWDFDAEWRAE